MRPALLITIVAVAALLLAMSADARPVRTDCSRRTCSYTFPPATTAAMKRAADRAGWLAGPAADIICVRLPHRPAALACAAALKITYEHARKRLNQAYAQGGCFTITASPVRFSVTPLGSRSCVSG
ncbi:hypothetical protein [Nonomuraea sediminis]|uniref:hypothetical protein n=1 Tax=Nonomuraea sediminis TaxID=2835864 RepID=UPI001BDDC396|nr:hypothetical protein [Nonomuraea sediminis]